MTSAVAAIEVGSRIAAWLRQAYPDNRAKRIARDFGCDERTAKSWLAGKRCENHHWDRMVARWGKAFLGFVYSAHFDWAAQLALEAQLEALQADLDDIRQQIKGTPNESNVDRTAGAVAFGAPAEAGRVVEADRTPFRTAAALTAGDDPAAEIRRAS